MSDVFAGPMSPGAALIVNSCGTHISENVIDGSLSHNIDKPYVFIVDSKSPRASKLHNLVQKLHKFC